MSQKGESFPIAYYYSKNESDASDSPQEENEGDLKLNLFYMSTMIFFATIGGFLFGYDTSVIAGANLYVKDDFTHITNFQKELVVSMTLLGAALGSISGGPFSDKFGRKWTIFIADILFVAG